jgi:hypothetical protein
MFDLARTTIDFVPFWKPSMKYALERDLAMLELKRPLRNHHGIRFSQDGLQIGQHVYIYGYPTEGMNPMRKLLRFSGTFKGATTGGLLTFEYNPSGTRTIRPGASGSIVLDEATGRMVGVDDLNGTPVVTPVPIQSLVNFVSKYNP